MTTKQLNRWQVRWAKFLSKLNFKISYRLGKKDEMPDTLTRLAQDKPKGINDLQQHQFQTVLKASQFDENIKKALAVMFYANETNEADEVDGVDEVDDVNRVNEVDEIDEVENKKIVDVKDYMGLDLHQHSNLEQNLEISFSSTKNGSKFNSENLLNELLSKAYQNNKIVNSIVAAKKASL